MRILIWSEKFWPAVGGVQLFLARLIHGLVAHGHDVAVLTADRTAGRPDEDVFEGAPVLRVPLFETLAGRDPAAILRLRRSAAAFIARHPPDVVHVNPLGPGAFLVAGPIERQTPSIVTIHATFEGLSSAREDTLFGRTIRQARWVTACSNRSLSHVLELAPEIEPRASVIPLGIEMPEREPAPPSFSPPRVLAIGRLVHMKGLDVAIDAIARVRATHPGVTLTIVGDGPERAELEARARALGIRDAVEFLGLRPPADVWALIEQSSLLVMTSRDTGTEYTEGLPFVVVEAAAMARAVVASRVGGWRDTIIDGETGVIVPPDDAGAVANAIAACLADPVKTTAMGRRGRAHVRHAYGWQACFDAYHALFLQSAGEA